MKLTCTYCNIELHMLCSESGSDCCCTPTTVQQSLPPPSLKEEITEVIKRKPGRPPKGPDEPKGRGTGTVRLIKGDDFKDALSTGRHRAAGRITQEYFAAEPECAWAGLSNAGGGVKPIVGCPGNTATDRHHGPDKSVLNNDEGLPTFGTNLHAICSTCHNRWHAQNDKFYLPKNWVSRAESGDPRPPNGGTWLPVGIPCLPHDPFSKADAKLIVIHEKWWTRLDAAERADIGEFASFVGSQRTSSEKEAGSNQAVGLAGPDASSDAGT